MKRNKLILAVLVLTLICTVVLCACNKTPEQPEPEKTPLVSAKIYFYVDYQLYASSNLVDGIVEDDIVDPVKDGYYFTGWLLDEYDETSTLASQSVEDLITLTNEVLESADKYVCVYASFSKGSKVEGAGLLAFNYNKQESISSMEMNDTTFTFVQKYTYNINNKKDNFTLDGKFKLSPTATYEVWEKTPAGDFVKSSLDIYLEFEYESATRYILVSCYHEEKKVVDQELYEFVIIRGFEKGADVAFKATDYFSQLWQKTAALGADAIDTTGFVAVSLDLSAELNEVEVRTEDVNQAIAIGFHIEMVVNCKDEDLNGTSIKVQVYDPAHNNNENFLTAYYFVDTPGYYYFDGDDGRHVKFKLNNGLADDLSSMLYGLLNDPDELADFLYDYSDFLLVDIDSGTNSIMDILLDMARTMGQGWDFNDAFESFCNSFNFNIHKEISRYAGIISGFLGISEDEMFDANGVLQVDNVLKSSMMNNLFLASSYQKDGVTTYQAKLNPVIITALGSDSVGKILKTRNLGKLIGLKTNLILSYDVDENGILDGFDLTVGLGDVIATVDGIQKYTQIKVCFNDMSVSNAKKGDHVSMPIEKENYSEDIVFNMNIKGDVDNIKGVHNGELYDLTGEFDTSVMFRLDTVNFGLTENKTQLYTFMAYNGGKFAEISLHNGKLAMTIDRSVKVKTAGGKEAPIVEVLAEMVGDNMQQFFDGSLIDVDNTKHRDDKEHREVIYRTILSIIDPSFMKAVYDSAFNKNPDGTYNFSDMKDDFVGIVFNDFDCQQLLVKMTEAYMEKNDLPSDNIDEKEYKVWQSQTISHVVADSSSLLDAFDMENVAKAIRSVMPVIHTEKDRLRVQTYQFENFIDSIVLMFKEGYTIVGKITANNKYRDLEYFASKVVIGDGEIYEYDPADTEKLGFQKFLHSVFSTDVMAMLDFNGLATDNAVEIQVGFENPGEYSMFVDLTMNLLEYNPADFVDVMDKANAGDFVQYKLVIYDKAQDCDDFVRSKYTYQGVSYEDLKAQDMEDWRKDELERELED